MGDGMDVLLFAAFALGRPRARRGGTCLPKMSSDERQAKRDKGKAQRKARKQSR